MFFHRFITQPHQRSPKERGFTLVELIVVISIIGIIASITVANMQIGNQRMRVRLAAENLVSLLRSAQTQAQEGKDRSPSTLAPDFFTVTVSPTAAGGGTYTLTAQTTSETPVQLEQVAVPAQVTIALSGDSIICFAAPFGKVTSGATCGEGATAVTIVFHGPGGGNDWLVTVPAGFGAITATAQAV